MIKRALIGIFISTILPAVICFLLFQVYKSNRESDAIELLQTPLDFRADKISNNIFLGDYESSLQFPHLSAKNTHIVAILNSVVLPPTLPLSKNYEYLVIKAEDIASENIIDTFPYVFDFIKNATEHNGTILVHCAKGASRSASLVMAYLMKENEMSFKEAYALVRKARPVVNPNKGFIAQLQQYHKLQEMSKKMVKKEEEEEKKEEAQEKESKDNNKNGEEKKDEMEYESYKVSSGIPAIYTCTNGVCKYLHGNIFTDALADVSMSVRYVIQKFLNKIHL